jgi:hypothetical protein
VSTLQFRIFAACLWAVALCFGIALAAGYETYGYFRDGARARATVTEIRPQSDWTWLGITLADDVETRRPPPKGLRVEDAKGLEPGDTIELLLHERNEQPILASELSKERPSFLLIVGLLGSIALGVYLWMQPTLAARRRAQRKSPLDALVEAAARTRNVSIGVGIFFVVAAAGFVVVPFFDRSAGLGGSIFIWVLGAVSAGLGFYSLRRAIALRDPRNNAVLDLILRRPHEIAWFYLEQVTSDGGGEALSAVIWTADKQRHHLTLVREDLDAVFAEIDCRAPHAKRGYDKETERLYHEQPDRWQPRAWPGPPGNAGASS